LARGEHHGRCAVAALDRAGLGEGLLDRVERRAGAVVEGFHRGDRARPSICAARITQVGINLPSTSTEQAPHSPVSQPCLTLHTPLRRSSAISVSPGSTAKARVWPLRLIWMFMRFSRLCLESNQSLISNL
jgi:hypothetical protein